jgi:prepilin-type N-terminal cleavage/methylation domain-containing protein
LKKIQGFTLIELLIVLVIIGIITSISLATINFSRPSPTQILEAQVKNLIIKSTKFAKRYNKITRLAVDNEKGIINAEYFDYNKNTWHNAPQITTLNFAHKKQKSLFDKHANKEYLVIQPTGEIKASELIIITQDEIITIELETDDTTNFTN